MKYKQNQAYFIPLLLLGWLLLFAACKSTVVPSSRTPIKDIETKELTQSIAKNQLEYKKFRSLLSFRYHRTSSRPNILFRSN